MRRALPWLALLLVGCGGRDALGTSAVPGWAERLPRDVVFGLAVWQWVGLSGLALLALVVGLVGRTVAARLLALRDRRAETPLPEPPAQGVRQAAALLAGAVAPLPFLPDLQLPERLERNLSISLQAVTVVGAVLLAHATWDAVCEAVAARAGTLDGRAERLLVPVVRKLVRFLILAAGFLLALGLFGVNIVGLLAGLGIGGLVVALAAKDSVENVFGSLTILFDMPFAIGDWVKIGTVEGVVVEINLRSTRVRTFEDSLITLPNANLVRASVENFGPRRARQLRFLLRVSYTTPADRLEAFCVALRAVLEANPKVQKENLLVEVNDLAEASLGVLVQCFFATTSTSEDMRLRHEIMLQILRLRIEHGVTLTGAPPVPDPGPS